VEPRAGAEEDALPAGADVDGDLALAELVAAAGPAAEAGTVDGQDAGAVVEADDAGRGAGTAEERLPGGQELLVPGPHLGVLAGAGPLVVEDRRAEGLLERRVDGVAQLGEGRELAHPTLP